MKKFVARRAFTLVEILVVIAILVILAAILFPVGSRSREGGRRTQCASNLKQLGLAWQMYADDSDGQAMPLANTVGSNNLYWDGTDDKYSDIRLGTGFLLPWLRDHSILRCPSWQRPSWHREVTTFPKAIPQGYGYNAEFREQTDAHPTRTTALSSIKKPAEFVLFADVGQIYVPNNGYYPYGVIISPPSMIPTFHGRHLGTGNVVWADGHVKAMAPLYLDTGNKRTPELQKQFEIGFIDRDGDYQTGEFFDLADN